MHPTVPGRTRRRLPVLPARTDEGSMTLFVVVIAVGLLIAAGLVVDGGGKVRALQRADAVAAAWQAGDG